MLSIPALNKGQEYIPQDGVKLASHLCLLALLHCFEKGFETQTQVQPILKAVPDRQLIEIIFMTGLFRQTFIHFS